MPYAKLLDQLIHDSGKTGKEISEQCQSQGVEITPSYISMLRNEKNGRIPSPEISAALAEALGVDENLLVLEGYMDNAPQPLRDAILNLYHIMSVVFIKQLGIPTTPEQEEKILEQMRQMPIAKMILEMAKEKDLSQLNQDSITGSVEEDGRQINVTIQGMPEFTVQDDSLSPKIQKGVKVKVSTQSRYNTGDIVAFSSKGKEKGLQYRQLQAVGDTILLMSFNKDYPAIQYNQEEMIIFGKVMAVTTLL